MNPLQYFENLSTNSRQTIRSFKNRLLRISIFRLIVFCVAAILVYFFWKSTAVVVVVVIVSIAVFLFLIRIYTDLKSQLKSEQVFLANCLTELEIIKGNWRERDGGEEFIDSLHPFSSDLNVFGKHSLFQFLNRSKTRLAKDRFAEWLQNPLTNADEIISERNRIADFSKHPEFLMRLLSHAEFLELDKKTMADIETWSVEKEFSRSKFFWFFTTLFVPAFAVTATILYAVDVLYFNQYLLCLLLPAAVVGLKLKEHQKRFATLARLLNNMEQMDAMLQLIKSENFDSPEVAHMFENVKLVESEIGLSALRKIAGAIESRNNVLVSIVLNLLLAWDFQCARRLENWKNEYGTLLPQWLLLANEIETYASFSIFVFENPSFIYPDFTTQNDFAIRDVRHVLMDNRAIPNSLNIEDPLRFIIITGANMAGKSTYLRAVGTTLLLAMRGLPVNAKEMRFKPTKIFTSMLSADSLGENASYFFNELSRLRQMITVLENDEPLFVILDEILKGTNSIDKAEGSKQFMKKLLTLPVKGLIATHDLSLCKLSDSYPEKITNRKFEVGFENEELVFDYKLEEGVCQNMNASFLLKKMGLTPQ